MSIFLCKLLNILANYEHYHLFSYIRFQNIHISSISFLFFSCTSLIGMTNIGIVKFYIEDEFQIFYFLLLHFLNHPSVELCNLLILIQSHKIKDFSLLNMLLWVMFCQLFSLRLYFIFLNYITRFLSLFLFSFILCLSNCIFFLLFCFFYDVMALLN